MHTFCLFINSFFKSSVEIHHRLLFYHFLQICDREIKHVYSEYYTCLFRLHLGLWTMLWKWHSNDSMIQHGSTFYRLFHQYTVLYSFSTSQDTLSSTHFMATLYMCTYPHTQTNSNLYKHTQTYILNYTQAQCDSLGLDASNLVQNTHMHS